MRIVGMAFAVAIMSTGLASAQLPTCGLPLQPKCTQCRDGVDNDFDALTDLADPGCSSTADNYEGDDPAPDVGGTADVDIDPRTTGKLFGFNTVLSSWPSGITVEQEAELIRNVGGNAQRIGIQWYAVEPAPGQYDESKLAWVDEMEAELRANGMRAIIVVWESPMWATDFCPAGNLLCNVPQERFAPPRDIAAYARFLAWVAQRYPEAAIETWNEPNIDVFWTWIWPDAPRMARMQCAAYDAIKAVSPSTTVLAPGLAYGTSGKGEYLSFSRTLYQKMGRVCWDALSVHIYQGTSVDGPNSTAAQAFRAIRNLRAQYGDTTPIWITETGATTSGNEGGDHGHTLRTPEKQRDINRAAVNEYLSTPDVGAVIIHTLRNRPIWEGEFSDPTNVQYGFGLLYDGEGPTPLPKPGYCHFVEVIGGEYPGCQP